MSLIMFESAKKYVEAANASELIAVSNGIIASAGNVSVAPTSGRDGGPAFQTSGSVTGAGVMFRLPKSVPLGSTIIFGFHVNFSGASDCISFRSSTDGNAFTGSGTVARLSINGSGEIEWKSDAFTVRATSELTLNTNEDYFIEGKIVLATDATGSVQVRVDGVDFIGGESGVSGENLITSASASIVAMGIRAGSGGKFDVFYVCDDQGSINNDFLGNVRTVKPAINSDHSVQFTPQGGGDNYEEVDEDPSDEDTTYNSSDTEGHKDLFGHANGITSDQIFGAQVHVRARKEASGTLGIKGILSVNSQEVKTGLVVPTTSYESFLLFSETNPETGQAWTANAANAAKVGYEATLTP